MLIFKDYSIVTIACRRVNGGVSLMCIKFERAVYSIRVSLSTKRIIIRLISVFQAPPSATRNKNRFSVKQTARLAKISNHSRSKSG